MNSNSSVNKQKQTNKQTNKQNEDWVSKLNRKIEFLCHVMDIKIGWINTW